MITVQVINTALGRPADLVPVLLDYFVTGDGWREVGHGVTDSAGSVEAFDEPPAAGIYRLTFDIAAYEPDPFFPTIDITFDVRDAEQDCHMALLLSPFGYSVSRT